MDEVTVIVSPQVKRVQWECDRAIDALSTEFSGKGLRYGSEFLKAARKKFEREMDEVTAICITQNVPARSAIEFLTTSMQRATALRERELDRLAGSAEGAKADERTRWDRDLGTVFSSNEAQLKGSIAMSNPKMDGSENSLNILGNTIVGRGISIGEVHIGTHESPVSPAPRNSPNVIRAIGSGLMWIFRIGKSLILPPA